MVRDLMAIEAARQTVQLTTLPPALAERLRSEARLRSTHFSTRIEGNRLTLAEAQAAVLEGRHFPGRTRDVHEVLNYYRALQQVEERAVRQTPISDELVCKLHALLFTGPRAANILPRRPERHPRCSQRRDCVFAARSSRCAVAYD